VPADAGRPGARRRRGRCRGAHLRGRVTPCSPQIGSPARSCASRALRHPDGEDRLGPPDRPLRLLWNGICSIP
jgi:hypothetical protein